MALASRLFQGDAAIEACAVLDSAHILQGIQGEHVARIQFALFALDGLLIDRVELQARLYGRSTADAVLAFKRKRAIINKSYQSTPDNIVGKMTIAILDREMVQREMRMPLIGDCKIGGFAESASAPGFDINLGVRSAQSLGVLEGRLPQLNREARIYISATRSASLDLFPIQRHVEQAKDLLFEHGIRLQVFFARNTAVADVINSNQSIVVDEDAIFLRKMSEDLRPGFPSVLRIFLCRMSGNFGETKRNIMVGNQLFKPFVLLNTRESDISDTTLLHEMIHASHNAPRPHDTEPFSVFFGTGSGKPGTVERRMLKPEHALSIARSFYAI